MPEPGIGAAFNGTVVETQIHDTAGNVATAEEWFKKDEPRSPLPDEMISSNPDCEYPLCLCSEAQAKQYCDIEKE